MLIRNRLLSYSQAPRTNQGSDTHLPGLNLRVTASCVSRKECFVQCAVHVRVNPNIITVHIPSNLLNMYNYNLGLNSNTLVPAEGNLSLCQALEVLNKGCMYYKGICCLNGSVCVGYMIITLMPRLILGVYGEIIPGQVR